MAASGNPVSGFCIVQISPLECHLAGILHTEIDIAELYTELALIFAQHIEDLHSGFGVYSFIQSCWLAGVPHALEAVCVKKIAVLNCKGENTNI